MTFQEIISKGRHTKMISIFCKFPIDLPRHSGLILSNISRHYKSLLCCAGSVLRNPEWSGELPLPASYNSYGYQVERSEQTHVRCLLGEMESVCWQSEESMRVSTVHCIFIFNFQLTTNFEMTLKISVIIHRPWIFNPEFHTDWNFAFKSSDIFHHGKQLTSSNRWQRSDWPLVIGGRGLTDL